MTPRSDARDEAEFGYAQAADGTYIGYQVSGEGPIDIVQQPDWPGNIDLEWDEPWSAAWLTELGTVRASDLARSPRRRRLEQERAASEPRDAGIRSAVRARQGPGNDR